MLLRIYPLRLERQKDCVKYHISQYVCIDNLNNRHQIFVVMRSEHWTQAPREKMDVLERNSTWEILTNQVTKRQ